MNDSDGGSCCRRMKKEKSKPKNNPVTQWNDTRPELLKLT